MRLLLDTCVWGGARKELQTEGHDVVWAGEWPEDPGDDEIHAPHHLHIGADHVEGFSGNPDIFAFIDDMERTLIRKGK